MFEYPTLLMRSWQQEGDGLTWRSWILEPASTALIGFAARVAPRRIGWLRWFKRPVLAIHESDDEPLLMTLRPSLSLWPTWQVRDAEEHLVGRVRGRHLLDDCGNLLALQLPPGPEGDTIYRGSQADLAVVEREFESIRLTFRPGTRDNPFVKMVLLAAALVHNQDVLRPEMNDLSAARGALDSRR